MNVRRLIMWLVIIFVIWFIVSQPAIAGHDAQGVIGWMQKAGHSLSVFFASL